VAAGLEPIPSQGGFFLMAKLPFVSWINDIESDEPYDYKFCRYLAEEYGVLGIPASPFFHTDVEGKMPPMARFAFCKKDKTILEAAQRLKRNLG
jgi:aspartate/methionine/tyrosine aminotransferase